MIRVDLCNNFVKIGEAVAYQFDGSIAHLRAGTWTLTGTPAGMPASDLSLVDSVLVWEDTTIRYAGIVRSVPGADAKYERVKTAEGVQVSWSGTDLFGLLGIRQCWPDPTVVPPWAQGWDDRVGVASTVATGYINANMGSTALAARAVTGVTIVNPAIGTSSTWSKRLEPLDTVVADVCREGGISCSTDMPTVGTIRYTFRNIVDYRNTLLFSDQGDLEQVNNLTVPATATYVLAAGQGTGTGRAFQTENSGETGIDRVETVYENTNITNTTTLGLAALAQLQLHDDVVSVDAVLADAALQRIRYGTDYLVGDILGLEVDSVRYGSPVRAVLFDLSPTRQRIRPLLGNASSTELSALLTDVSELGDRFSRQIA